MALILILHQAYELGSERLPAPQGQALASMIQGILGGDVPVQKYMAGAGMGAILSASGIGGLMVGNLLEDFCRFDPNNLDRKPVSASDLPVALGDFSSLTAIAFSMAEFGD